MPRQSYGLVPTRQAQFGRSVPEHNRHSAVIHSFILIGMNNKQYKQTFPGVKPVQFRFSSGGLKGNFSVFSLSAAVFVASEVSW